MAVRQQTTTSKRLLVFYKFRTIVFIVEYRRANDQARPLPGHRESGVDQSAVAVDKTPA